MFGSKPSLKKDYARIIEQIESGDRQPPSHDIPISIREPGKGYESFRTPGHEVFFEDFRWFQTMMNRNTTDPWCVEEMGDTLIRDLGADSPELGRRYRVYFNSCSLGTLQVMPSGFAIRDAEKYRREREAWAIIDLDYLRFIPWEDALNFVRTVHFFIGSFTDRDTAWATASARATEALTGYLWEAVRIDDTVTDFNHQFQGPYSLVQQTTEHWAAQGLDPITEWGGDRPDGRL